jgi:DNA-binding transcriptional LysR family regulator
MQLKRLEDALDAKLLDRSGRGVTLTPEGEDALAYARRICALNDELIDRMKDDAPVGELRLGVPHDVVPGVIPRVLRAFAAEFPRVKVALAASVTLRLHEEFARGEHDIIVGTEAAPLAGGQELVRLPLIWVGGPGGMAWTHRPLPLAFEHSCVFRIAAQSALDRADIPWQRAVEASSSRAIDASVGADLAVHVVVDGFHTGEMVPIAHGGVLPSLGDVALTIYEAATAADPARERLVELLRQEYGRLRSSSKPVLVAS